MQSMEMSREATRHVPSGWINEACPASQQKPAATLPPRSAGWDTDDDDDDVEPTQAQVSIPTGPVAQQQLVGADSSGWDSDEDQKRKAASRSCASGSKKAPKSKHAHVSEGPVLPTTGVEESGWDSDSDARQRSAASQGPANPAGAENSGWDSDGVAEQIPASSSRASVGKKKNKSANKSSVAVDSCGGVLARPAETLVVARPSKVKAKAAKHGAKRMKKDPNKPKRSRSAYLVFCDRQRPGLRKKYPSKTMIDLAGDLSKAWANVSTKEKGACEKIAAEEKAIYEKELKDYKPSAEWQKAVDAIANEKAGAKEKIAEAKKKAKEKMTKAKGKVQELKVEIAKIEKQVQAAAKLKTKVAGLQEDLSRTETKLEALMSK